MDLLQMEYFACVANSDTMLQAAETMNVSQSTLSMSIKRLEKELGVELFERVGRRLRLTPAGKRFLDGSTKILDDTDALKRSMMNSGLERSRTIILGTDAVDFSMESIALYTELSPDASFNPIRYDHKTVRSKLLTRQIDFAVTLNPLRDASVDSVLLLSEPMLLLCGTNNRHTGAASVSIRDLEGETFILPQIGTALRALFESYLSLAGVHPGLVIEVADEEALSSMASKDLGITFIPRSNCCYMRTLSSRPLFYVPITESFCYRNVYLSRIKGGSLSPIHKEFYDFLITFAHLAYEKERYPSAADFH